MTRPIKEKVISGATSTTTQSDSFKIGGRITLSLFVVTDSDPTTLDVEVDLSFDGTNFVSFSDAAGNQELTLSANDFEDNESNGTFAAFVTVHGVCAQYAQASITDYGSAGNVDVWLAATGQQGDGMDFREVGNL